MTSRERVLLPCVLVGTLILASVEGCDVQPAPSAPRADKPRPPEPPVQRLMNVPKTPSAQQGNDSAQRSGTPVIRPDVASSGETPPEFSARLSAGTAIPQSLPTGTAMGMNVDYVLLDNLLSSAVRTVWVIESAQGASTDVPVRLDAQGNLMTFVTNMRPEHGPFRSYLAIVLTDGRKVPISPKIDMRSP
jgi:hypothetical protein